MIPMRLAERLIKHMPSDATAAEWRELLLLITEGDRDAARAIAEEARRLCQPHAVEAEPAAPTQGNEHDH